MEDEVAMKAFLNFKDKLKEDYKAFKKIREICDEAMRGKGK